MRWWLLVTLAGCYSPGSDGTCAITCETSKECPGSLMCSDTKLCGTSAADCPAGPLDGPPNPDAVDAAADSPVALQCNLPTGAASFQPFNNVAGGFYTSDGTIAIYEDLTNILLTAPGTNMSGVAISFGAATQFRYTLPRLDPVSDQLYVLIEDTGLNMFQLGRATRQGASPNWNVPIALTIVGVAIGQNTITGPPSATSPRRMLIGNGQNAVFEGIEQSPGGPWNFTQTTTTFGNFTLVDQPAISIDGLHMLFVGRIMTGSIALFMSSRQTVDKPFETPVKIADNPDGGSGIETSPSFSPDCKHVFVSFDSPNRMIQLY